MECKTYISELKQVVSILEKEALHSISKDLVQWKAWSSVASKNLNPVYVK